MRLLRYLLFIVLANMVVGCDTRPSSVLSPEKMADVLFDIHRTDAVLSVMADHCTNAEKQEYYNSVFGKWDVTKQEFDRSLEWYAGHPDKIVLIYDTLRQRTDELQGNVENYMFHPDHKPTYLDSIDYFDMWKWQRVQLLENRSSKIIDPDSVRFEINDSDYFARGNDLIFDVYMKAAALDSASRFSTQLVFHYADSVKDTLSYTSFADSRMRHYHYFKRLPDTVAVCRLQIILADEPFYLTTLDIRNVKLNRKYHRYDSPVSAQVRREVRDAQDAVERSRRKKR